MGHLKEMKAPGLAQESNCVYISGKLELFYIYKKKISRV